MGLNNLRENEVRKMMFALLNIVRELHERFIKHNNITMDSVYTKRANNRLEIKLGSFENACII